MPNKTISDLDTELVAADVDGDSDWLEIDDVSAGVTKKVHPESLVAGGAVGALTAVAPANVTKAAAAVGAGTKAAREDHKHDIATATAIAISGRANNEGASTSLARADHTHQVAPTIRVVNSSPITLAIADGVLVVDTAAARTINLPDPSTMTALLPVLIIDNTNVAVDEGSRGNPITLARFGAETIDGVAANKELRRTLGRWALWTNGTDWYTSEAHGQKHNLSASAAPTAGDNASDGYGVGSLWVWSDPGNERVWVLVGFDATDAAWREILRTNVDEETGNFTLSANHEHIRITSAGAVTVTLPDPATLGHRRWKILLSHDAPGDVTLDRFGAETIQGVAADYVLSGAWTRWELVCDGTNWWLF